MLPRRQLLKWHVCTTGMLPKQTNTTTTTPTNTDGCGAQGKGREPRWGMFARWECAEDDATVVFDPSLKPGEQYLDPAPTTTTDPRLYKQDAKAVFLAKAANKHRSDRRTGRERMKRRANRKTKAQKVKNLPKSVTCDILLGGDIEPHPGYMRAGARRPVICRDCGGAHVWRKCTATGEEKRDYALARQFAAITGHKNDMASIKETFDFGPAACENSKAEQKPPKKELTIIREVKSEKREADLVECVIEPRWKDMPVAPAPYRFGGRIVSAPSLRDAIRQTWLRKNEGMETMMRQMADPSYEAPGFKVGVTPHHVAPMARAPDNTLDGIHPTVECLSRYLSEVHPKTESWVDALLHFRLPKRLAETDSIEYLTHKFNGVDKRLVSDSLVEMVKRPLVIGRWTYHAPVEYTEHKWIRSWRDSLTGVIPMEERVVYFCPHLVSNTLRDMPLKTSIEAVRANSRQRLLRCAGLPLADNLAAEVVAGSEAVVEALCLSGQLNSSVVGELSLFDLQSCRNDWGAVPPFSPQERPTPLVIEPARPTCRSRRPATSVINVWTAYTIVSHARKTIGCIRAAMFLVTLLSLWTEMTRTLLCEGIRSVLLGSYQSYQQVSLMISAHSFLIGCSAMLCLLTLSPLRTGLNRLVIASLEYVNSGTCLMLLNMIPRARRARLASTAS